MNYAQNILNICHRTTLAQGANGESVPTVTIAVAEVYIPSWVFNCQAIISVEDDIVLEQHIRALNVETYQIS